MFGLGMRLRGSGNPLRDGHIDGELIMTLVRSIINAATQQSNMLKFKREKDRTLKLSGVFGTSILITFSAVKVAGRELMMQMLIWFGSHMLW